ncbi:hypothetical protein AJ85_05005 [Alkalihalobacillus alcalophilus ATCC 27647 = CGMCC 1.3604]|uniref:Uncharacterized protein n=1 Tax=Alkalihalobacillus alcalophilus ATCC 27647 = CGMCC 1.3604 TaxID=1218173 RepID=A0A4S4K892_ALKAL|nr:hypothetical protein AJ85_05005 [Alkalihalobacillus alcalophilus ATCC 27647 = CGMCC 1.3604]
MAKSKAKKQREKLMREGRRNPENGRSPYVELSLFTRKTKTKKDKLYQRKHKNHFSNEEKSGSFYFIVFRQKTPSSIVRRAKPNDRWEMNVGWW